MRDPWFQIIEITELRGRSIADIAAEVSEECGVNVMVMRSPLMFDHILAARALAFSKIKKERPDVSSAVVGAFFNRDPSVVRHHWRKMAREAQ